MLSECSCVKGGAKGSLLFPDLKDWIFNKEGKTSAGTNSRTETSGLKRIGLGSPLHACYLGRVSGRENGIYCCVGYFPPYVEAKF